MALTQLTLATRGFRTSHSLSPDDVCFQRRLTRCAARQVALASSARILCSARCARRWIDVIKDNLLRVFDHLPSRSNLIFFDLLKRVAADLVVGTHDEGQQAPRRDGRATAFPVLHNRPLEPPHPRAAVA